MEVYKRFHHSKVV